MDFSQYVKQQGGVGKWPYPIEYGEETRVQTDVLVIGGGLAGCFAAVQAARRGCSVAVVEKGATRRAGAAGTGIDHWMYAVTNPACKITPEQCLEYFSCDPYAAKHAQYIVNNEAYEALLDFEDYGMKPRDEMGVFDGTPMKDPETGLLFAYDYDTKYCIRLYGSQLKPVIYKEMLRLGVKIYDRVMGTMLLTEEGKQGARVIGATGLGTRTGRFYVFNAKAVILATAKPMHLWEQDYEKVGSNATHDDPNCAGDGDVMAWKAGAAMTLMERSQPCSAGLRYPAYGAGNCGNTWFPCNMVDANNKYIPWTDQYGRPDQNVDHRSRVPENHILCGAHGPDPKLGSYTVTPTLAEDIYKGEYKLPLYADMTTLPDYERRGIWDLMLHNEGKTRTAIVDKLTRCGFDPERDMLQAPIQRPEVTARMHALWMDIENAPSIRETSFFNFGGVVVDWDLRTSLEGLFAAGNQLAGMEGASSAAATGRYCGRNVSYYIKDLDFIAPAEEQIAAEKQRIYTPLDNEDGYGWKEIQIGVSRVMQNHLGDFKTDEILELGKWWMDSIRNNELRHVMINNPHDLVRALEVDMRIEVGKLIMESSLIRKGTRPELGFERLDYPEIAPIEEECFKVIRLENGRVEETDRPFGFWLQGDNAPDYKTNYLRHAHIDEFDRRYCNG